MIIAEEQPLTALEGETGAVLDQAELNTTVMYIISLGGQTFRVALLTIH